jgi:hypothetical protein
VIEFSGTRSVDLIADADSPRQHLRDHLATQVTAVSDLDWYFDRSLPRFADSGEVRLAVEELVDHLGRIMGFAVERPDEEDTCAVWSSLANRVHLLVWVQDMPAAIARMGHCTRKRDELLPDLDAPTLDRVGCLSVVCGPVDRRLLQDAILVRRASDQVRLITVEALLSLAGMFERRELSHDALLAVLRPQGALADPLVQMLARRE